MPQKQSQSIWFFLIMSWQSMPPDVPSFFACLHTQQLYHVMNREVSWFQWFGIERFHYNHTFTSSSWQTVTEILSTIWLWAVGSHYILGQHENRNQARCFGKAEIGLPVVGRLGHAVYGCVSNCMHPVNNQLSWDWYARSMSVWLIGLQYSSFMYLQLLWCMLVKPS